MNALEQIQVGPRPDSRMWGDDDDHDDEMSMRMNDDGYHDVTEEDVMEVNMKLPWSQDEMGSTMLTLQEGYDMNNETQMALDGW